MSFPIIDLHCHLEGSISPDISYEILHRIGFPAALKRKAFFQKVAGFLPSWTAFSEAVSILDKCLIDRPSVIKVVSDIIERAVLQNVKMLELSFAPREFQGRKHNAGDSNAFFEALIDGIKIAAKGKDIALGLKLLILPRHLSTDFQRLFGDIRAIIRDCRPHLVGVDICTLDSVGGGLFDPVSIKKVCDFVRGNGLHLSAHAGEFGEAEPITQAIGLGIERLGHGIGIAGRNDLIKTIIAHNITLEICPASNYRTGAISEGKKHPLRDLLLSGVRVTINSDDQSVQNSTWRDDYVMAKEKIGLTDNEIKRCLNYSFEASFLNNKLKERYRNIFLVSQKTQHAQEEIQSKQRLCLENRHFRV